MAQNATHRRLLATPEAKPLNPVPSSMDPTLQKHRKSSSTHQNNKNPDPKVPTATPFYTLSSRLKTSVKPNKNTTCIETLLQAKDMTKSADFDASRRLRQPIQPNQQKHKANEPKVGKDIKPTTTKERTAKEKEKVKTLSHEEEEEKKEVYFLGKGGSINKEVNNPNFVVEGHELKRLSFGGRRRSFCGAQLELGDFLANNGAKVVAVDMPPFMQIHAIDCARKTHDSLEKFSSKALALTLKKEFDGVYGPAWHCIVGISFGSFVTHSVGGFLYFSIDQKLYILLFKTTVQRAD